MMKVLTASCTVSPATTLPNSQLMDVIKNKTRLKVQFLTTK